MIYGQVVVGVYAFVMVQHRNDGAGNDGMFFCHHRNVHFPVGLSTDKKEPKAKSMKTAAMKTSLLLVLGHLTDKRYLVALP